MLPNEGPARPKEFTTENIPTHQTEIGGVSAELGFSAPSLRKADKAPAQLRETTQAALPSLASEECSARNTSEFEEGPPRRSNPAVAAFNRDVAEARQLEQQIELLEAEADQRREPLIREQLLRAYRAWSVVAAGQIPPDIVESFIAEAGVKRHGNEKIPCSTLMRAIVGEGEAKGTPRFARKKQRASTYASAIDFAIVEKMSAEGLKTELEHPPTRGEHQGIENLAKRGREFRRGPRLTDRSDPPTEMPFLITGDLTGLAVGYHLMLVNIELDSAKGTFLHVPEKLLARAIAEHNKSPPPNSSD